MSIDNDLTVTSVELKQALSIAFKKKRPVMIWGPPGIGKSEIISQIAQETNRPVVDMRLLLMDPTDLRGIPFYNKETSKMEWAPPGELPLEGTGLEDAVLFFDELTAAPPSVQAASYQIILDRKIGQFKLPDGVDIVAAGNRESDRGVAYRMPTPLANRFLHFTLDVDFASWRDWAIENDIHPAVVGFLSENKSLLFQFKPNSNEVAFPTPRSWVFAASLYDESMPIDLAERMVASAVGTGTAITFIEFSKFLDKLPKVDDVLSGNVTELKEQNVSACYAFIVNACYTLKELDKNRKTKEQQESFHSKIDNFFNFMINNMQPELVVLGIRTVFGIYKFNIDHTKLTSLKFVSEKYGEYL